MKTAEEIYKKDISDSYFGIYDYQPIINNLGTVLIQVDDNNYQGDTRVLYEKEGKYGWLIFGWGSCSGCDSLQACSSINEVQDLMDELNSQIEWFSSLEELKERFRSKDWELTYSWHAEETRDFIDKVLSHDKS